jgi:ComEC/Rec2-related protein
VLEPPKIRDAPKGQTRCNFPFLIDRADDPDLSIPGSVVLVHAKGSVPSCGEGLRLRAALRAIPHARNPGQPDMADYWGRRGIRVEAFVTHPQDLETLEPPSFWQPRQWAAGWRLWISDTLARGIENQPLEHALIASMVLGVQSDGLREAEDWFRKTGTLHLFAVSGLNLTMLAWLLGALIRILGVDTRWSAVCTLPLLVLYAVATGLGPSCARALVGTALVLGCVWVDRGAVAFNNLGAAALLLLIADTNNLFLGGFQLSFVLVFALLQVATPLGRRLASLLEPDPLLPRKLWNLRQRTWVRLGTGVCHAVAGSLVAFVGGLPWSFWVFHMVSPVGVCVNLVVIPLAFSILSLGLLSVLASPLGPVSPALNRTNALLGDLLLKIVRTGASFPGGHWAVASPFVQRPDFVVFDTGSGAAVLLNPAGKPWLLDCGNQIQYPFLLCPGLRFFGLNRLEGLVLSHGDVAHIGGTPMVRRDFHPETVVDSQAKDRSRSRKQITADLQQVGAAIRHVAAGDRLQALPEGVLEVLYPPRGLEASLADDKCVVLRFSTPSWSLLYTADAGYPTERWLLEHMPDRLRSDVWVRGNHARELTGSESFVLGVNPALIIVSGDLNGPDSASVRRWAEQWMARGKVVWLQQDHGAAIGWGGEKRVARGFFSGTVVRW